MTPSACRRRTDGRAAAAAPAAPRGGRPADRAGRWAAAQWARWLPLALVAGLAWRPCGGVSFQAVEVTYDGRTPIQPTDSVERYIDNLAVDAALQIRYQASKWTFIGCHQVSGLVATIVSDVPPVAKYYGEDPLTCSVKCEATGSDVSAMQGTTCYCLGPGRHMLENVYEAKARTDSECTLACKASYFDGTAKLCGGEPVYVSVFQKYDYLHQTAGSAYDPWRSMWYQSVAVQSLDGTLTHILQVVSLSSGEPQFPFHSPTVDENGNPMLLLGLQFDLDSSRVVGYAFPDWRGKVDANQSWGPAVWGYQINTMTMSRVEINRTKHAFAFDSDNPTASSEIYGVSATALDSLHDVYYLVVPEIPLDLYSGGKFYTARNRVYAIDLARSSDQAEGGGSGRVVASRVLADESEDQAEVPNYRCVLLEVNSKYHTLYALVQKSNNGGGDSTHQYYYVQLGSTFVDEDGLTQLEWTFESVTASMVNNVPPHDELYLDFIHKTYSVGMSSVDSVTNTSFLVYRDSPDPSSAIYLTDIPQDGRNATEGFLPQPRPLATQGLWLANLDPIIPLQLPAPKLVSARFSTDARNIYVDFDANTIEGALPVDSDGDTIPDLVDWTSKQVGLRDCADMFTAATVAKLAPLPEISCEWTSSSRIQVNLPSIWWNINVNDPMIIREETVYSYVTDGNQWSAAASGGVIITNPDPVLPPVVEVTYASAVDFYSGVTFDASGSGNHGTMPEWRWSLSAPVRCDFGFEDATITASLTQELQAASYVDLNSPGSMVLEIAPGMMQAGCMYSFKLNLTSRWQLWTTKIANVTKAMVPAPQVYVMGPAIVEYTRSTTLNLQAEVEDTVYEGQMDSQQAVYAWSATRQTYDTSEPRNDGLYGPQEMVDISDLTDRYSSTSLQVPRYKLEPGYFYTFTVTSGYAEMDPSSGYGTAAEVGVLVGRSALKVNVLGGSRAVSKDSPIAVIDATTSLDPDFPLDDVSSNADWVFTYFCSVTTGDPPVTRSCFESITVNTSMVWDVADCNVPSSPLTFTDLDRAYSIPVFDSDPTRSSSSYCAYPGLNGVLALNLQGVGGLAAGDYSFVVEGAAHGRTARTILDLRVTAPFLRLPQVVVQPAVSSFVQAKVPIDSRFATQGDLAAEDKAKYGSTVAWGWSFYKVVANSAYNSALANEANDGGNPYLVPEFVLELTGEIDRFATPLTSATLVIPANVMQASTTYNFRLSGTVTDPTNGDVLTGYSDLVVMTAGSAPCCGTLTSDLNSSTVIQTRTFTASDWVAEDLPLSYMFYYRADLQNRYAQNVDLRVAFIAEPAQTVWCMRPGEVADNFSVEVTVKVQTVFGSTSDPYSILTTVEPPADFMAANDVILSRLEEVDAEAGAVVANCFMLQDPNPGFSSSATSTEQLAGLADSVVSVMSAQSESVPLTPALATCYLGSAQKMAQDGVVSDSLVDFVGALSDKVIKMSEGESYDTVRDMSSKVFSAIGQLLVASQDSADTTAAQAATDVNANGDETGAFFPAARVLGGRRLVGAGAAAGRAACQRPRSLAERVRRPTRRLRPLDERPLPEDAAYQVGSCAYPDWTVVPKERRDRRYWPPRASDGRRLTGAEQLEEAYEVQEALEQEWIAYLAVIEQQQQEAELRALRDEEYFANYSAHLSPAERETVVQAWSAEKAAALSVRKAQIALHKRTLQSMLDMISSQSANFATQFMVSEEDPTDFFFQAGELKVGKNRNLSSASPSFSFRDEQWALEVNSSETFEWELLKFTESNPWYFASNTISGPYIINALKIFDQNGTVLPVSGLAEPLNIMADHSSFASGVCKYFDWDADDGLGAWASDGLVTDDNGCASTHLSIIGLFLEATSPGEAFQEAVELALDTEVVVYNAVASFALAAGLVLGGVLHFWAFKQDGVDALKPVEVRELADGVKGPRSQEDPVHYSDSSAEQVLCTVWNLVQRDHILVACFFRDARLMVTRLQRASVLSAALAGTAAASAVLYGEHAVDPRHYVEIGIVSSTISFPMVALLHMLFAARPARDGIAAAAEGARSAGQQRLAPLWALPVPAEERSEESASDSAASRGAERLQNPVPLPPLPSAEARPRPHSAESWAWAPQSRPPSGVAEAPPARRSLRPLVPPPPPDGPQPEAARAPARLLASEGVHGVQPQQQDASPRRSLPPAGTPPMAAQASLPSAASRRSTPPAGSPPLTPPMAARSSAPSASSRRSLPPAGPPPRTPPAHAWLRPGSSPLAPLGEEASSPLGAGVGLDQSSSEGEDKVHPAASPGAGDWGLPGANAEWGAAAEWPPRPPLRDPRRAWTQEQPPAPQEAPPPHWRAAPPRVHAPAQEAASSAQLQARTNLLRRVRRMYIEKVIQNSERLAYDERLDIRSAATLPVAVLARAIAYMAVICFWVLALALCAIYAVHFSADIAAHWAYSCLSGWLFTWLVLEMVKILLSAFLELAQLRQRQRAAPDGPAVEDRVARLLEAKGRRMATNAASARPKLTGGMMLSLVPAPPLPPEPPPAMEPPPASAG